MRRGALCGDWLANETINRYNRLGALAYQYLESNGLLVNDTLRYDRSGNQIQRRQGSGTGSSVATFIYPAQSNRVATRRDSMTGQPVHSDQSYTYDAAGNRILQVNGTGTGVDSTRWQYDLLSRLVGTARSMPSFPTRTVLTHFNECRWDASWRLAQPCGASGQLSFVGNNVARSSLGWFFVQAPGIDESVLLVDRTQTWSVSERLQAVTDGRGQLISIADSSGYITAPYAGSGYDQAAWMGSGLTSRSQTYDPRRWQTDADWGGIQQFRNRAYDPSTGTWIQEDPIGVAGGVNLYQYSNANPASFGDPFGTMAIDTIPRALQDKLGNMCRNIDCNAADIVSAGPSHAVVMKISGGRAVTLGNKIYVSRALDPGNLQDVSLAAHELTHVGQFQVGGAGAYYAKGIGARISELLGGNPYDWKGRKPGLFSSYGLEQQAQIVGDCFRGIGVACSISPYRPGGN